MTRSRELLFGALLALFGVALAGGMMEIGVRTLHLTPDRFWEPDPLLGARLVPGKSGWWTQEDREFLVPIRISSQGLRDVEHRVEKQADVFRILVLGDSFVEAMHVPLEDVFTRRLEGLLNAAGLARRVEVISAGVSGYGTAGELLSFLRDGLRFRPDLVLLSFYPGNDVKNNSPVLEDVLKPVYGSEGEIVRVVGEEKPRAEGWRSLVAQSRAYQYLRQLVLVRQPRLAEGLVKLGLLSPSAVRRAPQRGGAPVDFGVYEVPASPEWTAAWGHTENLLDQLSRDVATAGATFAVMAVSTREQVYPDSWSQIVASQPAMQKRTWDLEAPLLRLQQWCRSRAVPCTAMAPRFRDFAARGGGPLHFARDGHWTSAGHKLAADSLVEFVVANSPSLQAK